MMLVQNIRRMAEDVWTLIFPRTCCACGATLYRGENVICIKCLIDMPRTNYHKIMNNEVEKQFWGRVPIVRATSHFFFVKGSRYQHLLHSLKYKGRGDVGEFMGVEMGHDLTSDPDFASIDIIVPVPLHPAKLRKRGYNQSEMIANGLALSMHKPVNTTVLRRNRFTETQTRKSRIDRWNNVSNVFTAEHDSTIDGRHVLIVDDVLTTGATIEGCANALIAANPRVRISVATLAFAHN